MRGLRRILRAGLTVAGCTCLCIQPTQADDPTSVSSAAVVVADPLDPVAWLERELRAGVDPAPEAGSFWQIDPSELEEWLAALRRAYAHPLGS